MFLPDLGAVPPPSPIVITCSVAREHPTVVSGTPLRLIPDCFPVQATLSRADAPWHESAGEQRRWVQRNVVYIVVPSGHE